MKHALSGVGMTSRRTRARMIDRLRDQGIRSEAVLSAMSAIPRHIFVDEALASRAYEDTALPLGFAQTISQPYIVARMIEVLLGSRASLGKTLEVGTGCGYQAAVLGTLTPSVYSVERIAPLLTKARQHLRQIPELLVRLKHADGGIGLPEAAPFDSIIVAAAARQVPPELLQQLASGGHLVLPIGGREQYLCHVEKTPEGFSETRLEMVRFVPLVAGIE
ncbi:MAG: protein-L-isoaspartate(D-aspartate) O-methyltransferase [Zoogloeaceae bacterium]|nr:protein-L-isoaspartate(D-aspartate) O-methyltransferase [Zoogloeaceae bacterium]